MKTKGTFTIKSFLLILLALFGCQNSKNMKNFAILNDSLFRLRNVKEITFPENVDKYIAMDSMQKSILFKTYLDNDLKSISFGFEAYFVAKQKKIGSLTPIIVGIIGTDYSAQWLMLLDSISVVISKAELGHEESGPRLTNDSTRTSWPTNISYFNNDSIVTISVIKTESNKDTSVLSTDSIISIRKVLLNGEILTLKSDTLRIKKKVSKHH